jgi:hypothetical protein
VSASIYVGLQSFVPTDPLNEVLGLGPSRVNRGSE